MPADEIRIMVVDDHAMLAESLVRLLNEDPSVTVVGTATTASEGVSMARRERPDIVLMDFHLPDMDGAEATRIIKTELPSTKVITLTGSERPGAYFAAKEAGSSAWVRKTRALHDLRDVVHRVHAGQPVKDDELDDLPTVDQLLVHYQPVIDLETLRIVGFEALVRWAHPYRGVVAPAEFLPLAEETGFIKQITRVVFEQATRQLASWQARFPSEPRLFVSINLSASSLKGAGVADVVQANIDAARLDPADVVLEITETVLVEDSAQSFDRLNQLDGLGVHLALDDFGTAFSSLSYLQRFPFDVLKIDPSFTAELPDSGRALLLVEAISQLAVTTGLRGIAEGIERPEQADVLRHAGWRYGQGYLYSKAVDPAACDAMLAAGGTL